MFEKSKSWKCKEESEKDINPEKISIALVYYYLRRRRRKQV
jgi:hypothetical protein